MRIKLDSRTSDALALALRYACPIYTTPDILEKAGIAVGQESSQTGSTVVASVTESDEIEHYSTQELTRMLNEAVQNEEYEKASKIRDILKNKTK